MRALRAGFTSIMFDGSRLPFEQNLATTSEVVKMCHAVGVTVEAELGHIGGAEAQASTSKQVSEELFTKVNEAEEFVRRTGVDALAVAVGTAHGLYQGKPQLDFERLDNLNRTLKMPLVLHGGTGLSIEDFRKAITLGVAKINFYTGMAVVACEAIRQRLDKGFQCVDFPGLLSEAKDAVIRVVEEQMEIFMSANVCAKQNALCLICNGCGIVKAATPLPHDDLVRKITQATLDALRKLQKS